VKQHLGRQSGVQNVEVSLIDGKVQITPKEDGTIDPAQLLKATYDSGVTAAEMDVTARGKIFKDSSGSLALQVEPNRSFALLPNELSKGLDSLVGTQAMVTVHGQLYKKPPGKRQKVDTTVPLKLLILEVEKKE
jgi:hypothetical protein